MTSIIITIVLNLLIGAPASDKAKDKDDKTPKPATETMTTMGGSGAWTNVDK